MSADLVRSWKDPESRTSQAQAHPSGEIELDIFGGQGAQAATFTITDAFSCWFSCESSVFDGTCNGFSIGCCPAEV